MSATRQPARLVDVLRALPDRELEALAARVGAVVDPTKRVDAPVQVARVLTMLPEVREPWRLPAACVQLLRRLVDSGGVLNVSAIPQALEPLAARGLVFARVQGKGQVELVLPIAFVIQLPPWEGEDPRGIRPLFAQASHETLAAIASHFLGKPATTPLSLGLEPAWETLTSPDKVAAEVDGLATMERKLLEAIEREGGEVDTEELLDLEREPLRIRTAMGATPSRRGVGFALERRGMLMPVHPNRHVIPSEVAAVIGGARASHREDKRAQIRAFVLDRAREPRRARFAQDPAPLAMALALAARELATEVRDGAGTPRSLLQRLAQRFGREVESVAVLSALSRAVGLWDSTALSRAVPPGSRAVSELSLELYSAWRRGGAWDEARAEPEVLRVPPDSRDPSPVGVLREIVLDALGELGEGRWVPFEALADYVRTDARTTGVARLLRRWGARAEVEPPMPSDIARRIVLETLPSLGIVDVGESDAEEEGDHDLGPLVRITARGRAVLQGVAPEQDHPTAFSDGSTLVVGAAAPVGAVLALHPFVDVGKVTEQLELQVTTATLSRAVTLGLDSDRIRANLELLAPLPTALARTLDQMSVIVGRASFVPVTGFLWCDDPEVREMLRTRRQTADLFLDPSPPGGLLVASGKELDAVARRCRALGVEVLLEGQVVRARSTSPPARSDRVTGRRATTKPPGGDEANRRGRSSRPVPR